MKSYKSKSNDIPPKIEELANQFSGHHWNTRIIKHNISGKYSNEIEYNGSYYGIHEVYYNKFDHPIAWTEEPIRLQFDDEQDFKDTLRIIVEAAGRNILTLVDDKLIETEEFWDMKGGGKHG